MNNLYALNVHDRDLSLICSVVVIKQVHISVGSAENLQSLGVPVATSLKWVAACGMKDEVQSIQTCFVLLLLIFLNIYSML